MQFLFRNQTPMLLELANNSMKQTWGTMCLENMPWVAGDTIKTFRKKSCYISIKECRDELISQNKK